MILEYMALYNPIINGITCFVPLREDIWTLLG